ncbi:hypothetical protein SALWKB12_2174 [Snodgrassella communis]|nr:hypothetical protein SALWKB12_2174 [Snodgrassella communis]
MQCYFSAHVIHYSWNLVYGKNICIQGNLGRRFHGMSNQLWHG